MPSIDLHKQTLNDQLEPNGTSPSIPRFNRLHHENISSNACSYRTELYLRQREQHGPSPSSNVTTWKDLVQQKHNIDHDQAEIDRVLSTMNSIHDTLNRSLIMPYNRVYSRFYGSDSITGGGDDDDDDDDDGSARLMRTFCQREDHYRKDDDSSNTHETLSSSSIFPETDSDHSDDERDEKKKSFDSGYESILLRRKFS
jgi:hypothetical protein